MRRQPSQSRCPESDTSRIARSGSRGPKTRLWVFVGQEGVQRRESGSQSCDTLPEWGELICGWAGGGGDSFSESSYGTQLILAFGGGSS